MFLQKKATAETFKKIGALLILIPLSIMLIFVFSSQSTDEIFSLFTSSNSMGSFAGENISIEDYSVYESACRKRQKQQIEEYLERMGDNANLDMDLERLFSVENCVERQIKEIYVLSKIGEYLYLKPEKEAIESNILDYARQQYNSQAAPSPEDRIPLIQIYHSLMQQYPQHIQQKEMSSRRAEQLMNNAIYISKENTLYEESNKDFLIDMKLIYYNDAKLKKILQDTLVVSNEETLKEYEQEKKRNPKIQPFKKMETQLKQRVKTRKLKTEVPKLKQTIQNGKWTSLEQIKKAAKMNITFSKAIRLEELNRVALDDVNLALSFPEVLKEILRLINTSSSSDKTQKLLGPFEVKPNYTVFLEITKIKTPTQVNLAKLKSEEDLEKSQKDLGNRVGRTFFRFLVDEETKIGNFKLKKRENIPRLSPSRN